jgi:enoyl-CoA hydratase/carnithine racemase
MADTDILYDVSQRIATVTLNRPDRLNAYTASLGDQLRAAMRRATDDPGVRVIILTGAGRGFCAGADMDNLAAGTASGGATLAVENPQALPPPFDPASSPDYQTVHSYFPAVPKPIIAAINGACAGLGLVYALYCDQRFAAAGAKFTTAFARRGLIAEHGISHTLPRLVGLSQGARPAGVGPQVRRRRGAAPGRGRPRAAARRADGRHPRLCARPGRQRVAPVDGGDQAPDLGGRSTQHAPGHRGGQPGDAGQLRQ